MILTIKLRDPDGFEKALRNIGRIPQLIAESRDHMEVIQASILQGFEQNFEREAAGPYPWVELAPRTVREREELIEKRGLAIEPEHPILVRTGEYKRSWTDPGHARHLHDAGEFQGTLVVVEGSKDPRVARLSEGVWLEGLPERPVEELGDDSILHIDTNIRIIIGRAQREIDFGEY